KGENEVLFMIGSLFKLKYVDHDSKEQVWIIKLELCSEQDYQLKDVYESMKEQVDKNINLLEPGNTLFRMGELDKAEKYYQKLLSTLKDNNNPLIPGCYHGLDQALKFFQQALELKLKYTQRVTDYCSIGTTYTGIGNVYQDTGNYSKALENYERALDAEHEKKFDHYYFHNDDLHVANIYNNLGELYRKRKKYGLALNTLNASLILQMKLLPKNHYQIGLTLMNIGIVHNEKGEYNQALIMYKQALEIQIQTLPEYHMQIGQTYYNLACLYERVGNNKLALEIYCKALHIYDTILLKTHRDLKQVQNNIQTITKRMGHVQCHFTFFDKNSNNI
ncbi:unnamed protein product, partial [Didymodactylos carnosus]